MSDCKTLARETDRKEGSEGRVTVTWKAAIRLNEAATDSRRPFSLYLSAISAVPR
jgi:hypothetical protein